MDKRGLSLREIQEVPKKSLTLLTGPPGAGKSSFCHQVVLNGIAAERPIIFVTTEQSPPAITGLLREKGMKEPVALSFVDAFAKTVGLATQERPDTIDANCEDLNSISMGIAKLQQKIGKGDILLAFDSLTSPYLFNKEEIFRFIRLGLAKFAAEGNSVLALVDEGCGKEEDLVAMMSVADGILRMETKESSRIINVVKHPKVAPTKIETPMTWSPAIGFERFDPRVVELYMKASFTKRAGQPIRTEVGDFVNVLWRNLAFWSGMLWDSRRLPTIAYNFDKEFHTRAREMMSLAPWRMRLLMKLFMPKSFSEVKGMKKIMSHFTKSVEKTGEGIFEYMEEASRKDEHYFRVYENANCWGFDNVGARLGFLGLGERAGLLKAFEKEELDWNVIETKCIGLGDPYCEFKTVPGGTDELKDSLEAIDSSVVEKVHKRLMDQLTGFLVPGQPLLERPRLGSGVLSYGMVMATSAPALCSERYRMALRMGGAKMGKEAGEHLMNAGMDEDEVIRRVIHFMEYCKVGKTTVDETIRMKENCETFGLETGEPSCFFTTGFLNGLFSAVKNQHVREIKCIAAGDPYCEWEII